MYVGKMSSTFEVYPIPAFRDNYIWLIRLGNRAAVVDPGDASPVLSYLESEKLMLDAILVTHHHDDHIDGIPDLLGAFPSLPVYAPRKETYAFKHTPVGEGDHVDLESLGLRLTVMETPGHTLGHVVYYGANSLFCGDTLFSAGCGRLFEGTAEQMLQSLQRLSALPDSTAVYCTHEYTQGNCAFALHVEPGNAALAAHADWVSERRASGLPTLPSRIELERAINPFLRSDQPAVREALHCHRDLPLTAAATEGRM